MSKRIGRGKVKKALPANIEVQPTRNEICFSFMHFDFDNNQDKFSLNLIPDAEYPSKLIAHLKGVSTLTYKDFVGNHSKALRAHSIKWHETSCAGGFAHMNEQLKPDVAHYFCISKGEKKHEGGNGRVIGFFTDSVFNVVWLDPQHNLYP